jgi:opacity protein-like surface antigen
MVSKFRSGAAAAFAVGAVTLAFGLPVERAWAQGGNYIYTQPQAPPTTVPSFGVYVDFSWDAKTLHDTHSQWQAAYKKFKLDEAALNAAEKPGVPTSQWVFAADAVSRDLNEIARLAAKYVELSDKLRAAADSPDVPTFSPPSPGVPTGPRGPVYSPIDYQSNGGFVFGFDAGVANVRPTLGDDFTGSGYTGIFGAHFGYRIPSPDRFMWGQIDLSFLTLPGSTSFPRPFDDASLSIPALFSLDVKLGPNFADPWNRQWTWAPFISFGVAVADFKLSTPSASDSKWTAGLKAGAGLDVRINPNLLWRTEFSFYDFGKQIFFGPDGPEVSARAFALMGGFSYQFNSEPFIRPERPFPRD